eukprot:6492781-Amphidinium_carterae.3
MCLHEFHDWAWCVICFEKVFAHADAKPLERLAVLAPMLKFRAALDSALKLDGKDLIAAGNAQDLVACSRAEAKAACETVGKLEMSAFTEEVVANMSGLESHYGDLETKVKAQLLTSLQASAGLLRPLANGLENGSWKEHLSSDAGLTDIMKASKPLREGETAIKLAKYYKAMKKDCESVISMSPMEYNWP